MSAVFMHVVVYVAVNGLLIGCWVLFGDGTAAQVEESFTSLDSARTNGFWPLYVMMFWGTALCIHIGAAIAHRLRRRTRQRRRAERKAARAERRQSLHGTGATEHGDRGGTKGDDPSSAEDAAATSGGHGAAATQPPRRWVAVMFTDIVASTTLAGQLGDDAFARALAEHRATVRTCLEAHGGSEVGTQGDGFLIRFDQPDDAARCAVALQRAVTDDIAIRIGIHAGEVVHDGADDDLVGKVVHLASRVTDVAEPAEVLITEAVADQLHSPLPVTDRGLRELKGFEQPRHLLSLVWQEAPASLDLR